MDFKNLSLIELDELVKTGKTTYDEIYTYFLERTKEHNLQLNAFTTLPLDKMNLSGLPIAVKDIFCET